MTTIVFSKDRAMQLEAFLRSYKQHAAPIGVISVLFLATTERHLNAYEQVFERFRLVNKRSERDFRTDVLTLLPESGNIVFFVDDQVFIRSWLISETSGLSLRLGLHLTRCYPTNSQQALPSFDFDAQGFVRWRWSAGERDWGYPLSLDGHVFDAAELQGLVESFVFNSPNTLEAGLQQFSGLFMERSGACYSESKVVNVPWNRVQTDCENRCATTMSVDEMLMQWEAGKRIDLRGLYGVVNESAHQEFPLVLERRL